MALLELLAEQWARRGTDHAHTQSLDGKEPPMPVEAPMLTRDGLPIEPIPGTRHFRAVPDQGLALKRTQLPQEARSGQNVTLTKDGGVARPGGPAAGSPYRSKLEARYAQHVAALQVGKQIRRWWYEPVKLRLAAKTFYSPDFLIENLDGSLVFIEVKGWMRDDAAVKLKVAAAQVPWARFVLVRWEQGQWIEREVLG